LSEIELICHRVAILDKGRLIKVARTEDLLTSPDRYEVVARGIKFADFEHSRPYKADGQVVFTVAGASQREALERVWAAGGEVLNVNPVRRTLEQVFVELTQNRADA
jgi:ABC-2 type transport system ATP-binding protein